jgi:hypothetical protein
MAETANVQTDRRLRFRVPGWQVLWRGCTHEEALPNDQGELGNYVLG